MNIAINHPSLDVRLENDSIYLGELNGTRLLLADNMLVTWFILVPYTDKTEICDLEPDQQGQLYKAINDVSHFIKSQYTVDKLNVAAIGNIVNQLHVHVVGRKKDDYCWPNVVWGTKEKASYTASQLDLVVNNLERYFADAFQRE